MMIEVSQIKKSFGDQVVLNSISFSVKGGRERSDNWAEWYW